VPQGDHPPPLGQVRARHPIRCPVRYARAAVTSQGGTAPPRAAWRVPGSEGNRLQHSGSFVADQGEGKYPPPLFKKKKKLQERPKSFLPIAERGVLQWIRYRDCWQCCSS
jgi:hypothetical protein